MNASRTCPSSSIFSKLQAWIWSCLTTGTPHMRLPRRLLPMRLPILIATEPAHPHRQRRHRTFLQKRQSTNPIRVPVKIQPPKCLQIRRKQSSCGGQQRSSRPSSYLSLKYLDCSYKGRTRGEQTWAAHSNVISTGKRNRISFATINEIGCPSESLELTLSSIIAMMFLISSASASLESCYFV